jgi:hypothetical protein
MLILQFVFQLSVVLRKSLRTFLTSVEPRISPCPFSKEGFGFPVRPKENSLNRPRKTVSHPSTGSKIFDDFKPCPVRPELVEGRTASFQQSVSYGSP